MSQHDELKRLAEAAPEGPWFGPEYAPGTSYVFDVDLGTLLHYESIDTEQDACLRYVAAANPAAVLTLIAENERIAKTSEAWERLSVYSKSISDSFRAERDQLKAENEALRKDSERLQSATAFVQKLCDAAVKQPSVATGYLHDILSAMGKEEQS